jgi:hypothetical protein
LRNRFRSNAGINQLIIFKEDAMRTILGACAVAACLVGMAQPAMAEGCMEGAAAGGVVGHVAGHHAVVGAAGGCAIGHHEAKKKDKENKAAAAQGASGAK